MQGACGVISRTTSPDGTTQILILRGSVAEAHGELAAVRREGEIPHAPTDIPARRGPARGQVVENHRAIGVYDRDLQAIGCELGADQMRPGHRARGPARRGPVARP